MAKSTKQKEKVVETPIAEETAPIVEIPDTPEVVEPEIDQTKPQEPVSIPDVPAQMGVEPISETVPEVVKADSDEILFLYNILAIQRNGGFGRHLDGIINDRIKFLKGL